MKRNVKNSPLLSDQVTEDEIRVIMRELDATLQTALPGDIVEFGCYVGTTSVYLGAKVKDTSRTLWLYDSFEGLPEKTVHDESPLGVQFVAGELHATRRQLEENLRAARLNMAAIKIKKAWFSDLTSADIPEAIAFAFLDGDYYRSVLDPLVLIWPRLAPGATVIIDDYGNQALPGAAQAVDEWVKKYGLTLRVEASLAIIKKP